MSPRNQSSALTFVPGLPIPILTDFSSSVGLIVTTASIHRRLDIKRAAFVAHNHPMTPTTLLVCLIPSFALSNSDLDFFWPALLLNCVVFMPNRDYAILNLRRARARSDQKTVSLNLPGAGH